MKKNQKFSHNKWKDFRIRNFREHRGADISNHMIDSQKYQSVLEFFSEIQESAEDTHLKELVEQSIAVLTELKKFVK